MPDYRRAYQSGGTWCFTVNALERDKQLLTDHIGLLWHCIRKTKRQRSFRIDAMVILPDHLHAVWSLPEGDTDFPTRWRLIKTGFSKGLAKTEPRDEVRIARNERGIWQRRYWEHLITDDDDLNRCIDYCYWNPVKHGLVERMIDWPHSTYHRDLRAGRFEHDWQPRAIKAGSFGEPP